MLIAVLTPLIGALLLVFTAQSWWAVTGTERATVYVDECHTESKGHQTCTGWWQMPDGARWDGRVEGADRDDIHRQWSGWANRSRGYANHLEATMAIAFGYLVLLGEATVAVLLAIKAGRAVLRRIRASADTQ